VPKRDDLHVQCCVRTDQQPERVQERNDDGHDESSLFGSACNLNRDKTYRVFGRHSRVYDAAFSADGTRLGTGSVGDARVWRLDGSDVPIDLPHSRCVGLVSRLWRGRD